MSLQGKRIVLTGTEETIRNIATRLSPKQAEVIPFPTIEVETRQTASNQAVLQNLEKYNWLVFTSKQGVHSFCGLLGENEVPSHLKIAVIGEKTREVVVEYGLEPDFVSPGKDKNDLLEGWQKSIHPNDKILLAVSALADDSLEKALADLAEVHRIDVYTTHVPGSSDRKVHALLVAGRYDRVVFTSPSSVRHFRELVGELPAGELILSIGPTTSQTLQKAGCKDFLEAAKPSAESIVDMLEKFYTNQKSDHGIS